MVTSGPMTAHAPMDTPWPRRALGSTSAAGWIDVPDDIRRGSSRAGRGGIRSLPQALEPVDEGLAPGRLAGRVAGEARRAERQLDLLLLVRQVGDDQVQLPLACLLHDVFTIGVRAVEPHRE